MAYRTWKPGERERSKSPSILIYGETNVGKSASPLASLPEPIFFMALEDRDPELALDNIDHDVNVTFVDFDDIQDVDECLGDKLLELRKGEFKDSGGTPFQSIVFDGATYIMLVVMRFQAEDETKNAGTFQKSEKVGGTSVFKFERQFVDSTRLDPAAWGAFASRMNRITRNLKLFSKTGIPSVMTALLDKDVKWDNTGRFQVGPLFGGNQFPRSVSGHFDLIGLVEPCKDKDGRIIYPPYVSFGPPGSDFMCKWTGPEMKQWKGRLDFGKILGMFSRGRVE
jgi:hypothetical protein